MGHCFTPTSLEPQYIYSHPAPPTASPVFRAVEGPHRDRGDNAKKNGRDGMGPDSKLRSGVGQITCETAGLVLKFGEWECAALKKSSAQGSNRVYQGPTYNSTY